jgi:hypothetical protein
MGSRLSNLPMGSRLNNRLSSRSMDRVIRPGRPRRRLQSRRLSMGSRLSHHRTISRQPSRRHPRPMDRAVRPGSPRRRLRQRRLRPMDRAAHPCPLMGSRLKHQLTGRAARFPMTSLRVASHTIPMRLLPRRASHIRPISPGVQVCLPHFSRRPRPKRAT